MKHYTKPLSARTNMLWNSIGSLTYYGCQWLTTVLVVRLSTNFESAGVLALVMSIYNIFQPFAVYRMYTYQISDVNRENTTAEYLAFRAFTCFCAFSLCACYAAFTCSLETLFAVVFYCLYKSVSLFTAVWQGQEQVYGRLDYVGKALSLHGILSLIAFCSVLSATSNIHYAIAAMFLASLLVALLYEMPRFKSFEKISFGISKKKTIHLLLRCFPIVIASVALSTSFSIPRQYLSTIAGDNALGIYASIAAPAVIIQMGATYIYNPLLTYFANYYKQNNRNKLLRLLFYTLVGIVILGIFLAFILNLISAPLFTLLYGNEIIPYLYLFLPVIAVTILTALVWFMSDLLVTFRCFKGSFFGNVIAFFCSIPASIYCITNWDMNGVSFAGIISCTISIIVMTMFTIHTIHRQEAT